MNATPEMPARLFIRPMPPSAEARESDEPATNAQDAPQAGAGRSRLSRIADRAVAWACPPLATVVRLYNT